MASSGGSDDQVTRYRIFDARHPPRSREPGPLDDGSSHQGSCQCGFNPLSGPNPVRSGAGGSWAGRAGWPEGWTATPLSVLLTLKSAAGDHFTGGRPRSGRSTACSRAGRGWNGLAGVSTSLPPAAQQDFPSIPRLSLSRHDGSRLTTRGRWAFLTPRGSSGRPGV
jgi:hypothetical protein